MTVPQVRSARPAPLELNLEPRGVFATDGVVLGEVVLEPCADALSRIDESGQGRRKPVAVAQLGYLDFRNPIVPHRECRRVAESVVEGI